METTKELEETLAKCMDALRNMGLTAKEYMEQVNFILRKLGEMYNEIK